MRRAFEAYAAAVPPPATNATSEGFPVDADPGNLIDATIPGDFWFYQMTEAVVTVIERARAADPSFALPSDAPEQFRDALLSLFLTRAAADGRYLRDVPSEFLTQTEGDSRYQRRLHGTIQLRNATAADFHTALLAAFPDGASVPITGFTENFSGSDRYNAYVWARREGSNVFLSKAIVGDTGFLNGLAERLLVTAVNRTEQRQNISDVLPQWENQPFPAAENMNTFLVY